MKTIHRTIHQVVEDIADKWPNRESLVHTEMGVRYSYSLLSWEAERVCKGLLALGLKKGNPIAIWAPNIPEWIVDSTNFGIVKNIVAGLALALLVIFRPQGIFGDKREQAFDVR